MEINGYKKVFPLLVGGCLFWSGCTVKAVGDPNRPITINAHITIDVKGLKETANGIEDYVSGSNPTPKTSKEIQSHGG